MTVALSDMVDAVGVETATAVLFMMGRYIGVPVRCVVLKDCWPAAVSDVIGRLVDLMMDGRWMGIEDCGS